MTDKKKSKVPTETETDQAVEDPSLPENAAVEATAPAPETESTVEDAENPEVTAAAESPATTPETGKKIKEEKGKGKKGKKGKGKGKKGKNK